MQVTPFHILGLSLPTLILLYAMSTPAVGVPRVHREAFGNGEVRFEARFVTNPDGWLLRQDPKGVKFAGLFRQAGRLIEVQGVRTLRDGKPAYRFTGAGGSGVGERIQGKRGCPEMFHLRWSAPGEKDREAVLPSGPCYSL